MIRIITSIVLIKLFLGISVVANAQDSLSVKSPDGNLVFKLSLSDTVSDSSKPFYHLSFKDKTVIDDSYLGLKTNPNGFGFSNWYHHLKIIRTSTTIKDTNWIPVYGEKSIIKDHYHELIITFQSYEPKRKGSMQLIVRAYNEGLAFKYHFPEDINTQILEFAEEETYFNFPENSKAWFTPIAQSKYKKLDLKDWDKSAELPLTVELPNGIYAAIAQAEMVNYPRVRLMTTAKSGVLKTQVFGETVETSPYSTSWRVIMVAENSGKLLENNFIILNLNPPSAIKNTSWIKPGRVMREVTLSTSGAKKLVDFAVEQQLDYIHFDAGWYGHEYDIKADASTVTVDPERNPKGDLNIKEAIAYAKSKGIKVLLYVNHRALEKQLDSIFPLYKSWGVSGVKYGFVHNGSQHWNKWIYEAVKKAAQYELVVDIHDEYRPTGLSRTYPNLLTQEGVLGNEGFPDASHNTILPFTRYLAGAGDYTFCFNTDLVRPGKSKTTQVHQLALPVIFYSPLQFLFWYGKPDQYLNKTDFEFWKGIPTVWDETVILSGTPGNYINIARKKGSNWYLGSITNTDARSQTIALNFLDNDVRYTASIYEDDGKGAIKKRVINVNSKTTIKTQQYASGGTAILIRKDK